MTPFLAPPVLSLALLMAFTAIVLLVLGDDRRDREAGPTRSQEAPPPGPRSRTRRTIADRFRRNWMTWYWIGLGVVLAIAAVYHARAGLFHQLATCEGRTIHRDFVLDVAAFTIAAIAYPFVIRAVLRRGPVG